MSHKDPPLLETLSTPCIVEALLWCHSRAVPFGTLSHAQLDALELLEGNECIMRVREDPVIFGTTEKGRVLVQMILDTPLPVAAWVDPRKERVK